ncbi:GNAT family N-acetyltransferase [Litoreibacter sp.]|nr:GNAT family N-acetyltransferase [Litoreibacter sp.]
MAGSSRPKITFARLPQVDPRHILAHMSDPRVAEHMPLLTAKWDMAAVTGFVSTKEACWARDGLGHWAVLADDRYVGWGGYQREADEWDFGLVLTPNAFGLGMQITRKALALAVADQRIPFVTFLLPPSRKHLRALDRFGARFVGQVDYEGAAFLKYRLETTRAPVLLSAFGQPDR